MRIFWLLILVLTVAVGGVWFWSSQSGDGETPIAAARDDAADAMKEQKRELIAAMLDDRPPHESGGTNGSAVDGAPMDDATAPVETKIEDANPIVGVNVPADAVTNDAVTTADGAPAETGATGSRADIDPELDPNDEAQRMADELLAAFAGRGGGGTVAAGSVAAHDGGGATPPWESTSITREGSAKLKAAEAEAALETFEPAGSGTVDDPYLVSWDQLLAAAESYRPDEGKTTIPEHLQALNGKHVRVTGYLAFPLGSSSVEEALVMLNQWDGCCIGVPPSVYDSVEVKFEKPIDARAVRYRPFGTIHGVLKVEPYLVEDWLVGLYLMEGATLEVGM